MLTPLELGRRLKAARDSCGLTQDDVAAELKVSRSTVAQIEAGNRGVSGIELGQLAFLFGRDMREFLATEYQDANPLGALFRAEAEVSGNDVVVGKLRECVALGRELTNLERLVGIDRDVSIAATYQLWAPRNRWDAIEQGARIADEERRRLGLGAGPAPDLGELLETQGVRTALVVLPEDVSGLTISDSADRPVRRRERRPPRLAPSLLVRSRVRTRAPRSRALRHGEPGLEARRADRGPRE